MIRVVVLCFISFTAFAQEPDTLMKVLPVRMNFPAKKSFEIRLFNYDGDHLLWSHKGKSAGEGELFMIDPKPFVDYGLKKFKVLVLDSRRRTVQEIYFRVNEAGGVIKE